MGRKFDIDHGMDYAVSLQNKVTGDPEGRILAYYTKSGTCYAMVQIYTGNSFDGAYHVGTGSAGGYGYDKRSSAISEALSNAGIQKGPLDVTGSAARFTSCKYSIEEVVEICKREKYIPVYAGTGNESTAFGIFWNFVEVYA